MKKRILSLVLCAAMLLSMCLFLGAGVAEDTSDTPAESTAAAESYAPAVNFTNVAPFVEMNAQVQHGPARAPMLSAASANAANTQLVTNDGVVTTKTATANDDGTYTITLTSYTTGNVTQQQTTKPTDIVLVLDQSGSMANAMGKVNYNAYSGNNTQNSSNYEKRHNGGSANLWYKLSDGSYVSVSVSLQQKFSYNRIDKGWNDNSNNEYTNYWDNRENLYTYVNGELKKVIYTRTRDNGFQNWNCTYALEDGTILNQNKGGSRYSPTFQNTDDGYLYLRVANDAENVYTYTYTDSNGAVRTIGTSTGASTRFTPAFYQRSVSATGGGTRLEALKAAANTFLSQVSAKAKAEGVDHRVAVVGFASTGSSYTHTELLSTNSVVNYSRAQYTDYKDALVSINGTNGGINSRLTTAINRLAADGDTYSEYGIDMANKIFAQHSTGSEADRQRVVVVFTDGYTAPSGTDDFKYSMADAAIEKAHTSKSTYHATVYTIGIFSNADPAADITSNFKTSDGWSENWLGEGKNNLTDEQELTAANRYMHYVSSNYPDATSLNNGGNLSDKANPFAGGASYYLSAGDADSLKDIFEKISNNISSPTISLGSTAYVQDTVSPYFTAPANASAIEVYTEDAVYDTSNNLTWTNKQPFSGEKSVVGKTVKVTGFDYDKNFVSVTGRDENDSKKDGTFYGRRLVVTFTVEAETAFLGGNNVPTNVAESSGVYQSDRTVVENFDQPEVNVPIKAPTLTKKDANVYYGGDVPSAEQLCSTAPYDNAMADFVKIRYETNGTVSNTKDGMYTVTMTVSPKDEAKKTSRGEAAKEQSATVTSKVNVYKPEITYKDSVINLGDIANYTNNFVSTVWKHGEQTSTDAGIIMVGKAPALSYEYNPLEDAFKQDTYVKVTVKIGDMNITTDAVTFQHQDSCTFTGGCSFDKMKGQFIVHINVFDLTIQKTAKAGTTIDPNQTFVFKVQNNETNQTMEVVITGEGKKTIKNLPMGNYTITEDTNWSWKYTPVDKNGAAELSQTIIATGATTVTFENENKGTNWLTSIAEVINKWINGEIKQTEIKK